MCTSLCTTVVLVHNTAQNTSNDLPSYPPHDHQGSLSTGLEGEGKFRNQILITNVYSCTIELYYTMLLAVAKQ